DAGAFGCRFLQREFERVKIDAPSGDHPVPPHDVELHRAEGETAHTGLLPGDPAGDGGGDGRCRFGVVAVGTNLALPRPAVFRVREDDRLRSGAVPQSVRCAFRAEVDQGACRAVLRLNGPYWAGSLV